MSSAATVDKRAALLASTALGLFNAGRMELLQDAARALREAIHLSPNNPQVRAAFQHIQETQDAGSKIPDLCKKLLEDGSVASGEEALKIIQSGGSVEKEKAKAIVLAIVQYEGEENTRFIAGKILAALVAANTDAKTGFVALVANSDMRERIYKRVLKLGREAIDSLTSTILDSKVWKDDQQETALKSWFQFLVTQVTQSKPVEVSIRPISRLLAVEAKKLEPLVGETEFTKLLALIHEGSTEEFRTGALLAAAKYLEAVESDKALKLLGDFLTSRIASDNDEDMSLAFNVAAALFPVATTSLSALFLTNGFVQNLVPSLQGKPPTVEVAAINLMSSACVDKACRDAVSKNCEEYLKAVALSKGEGSAAASLTLAKLSGNDPETLPGQTPVVKPGRTDKDVEELAASFKTLLTSPSEISKQQSVEGLAYTSLTPTVKEKLVADRHTISALLDMLKPDTPPATLFGVLTTFDNITRYTKPLSEEQLKMTQLKNYANAQPQSKDTEIHKLDKDAHVSKRCKAMLDAGLVPALVRLTKKISPTATNLAASILLSLSRLPAHRGIMAQQGAVKFLLQIYAAIPHPPTPADTDAQPEVANPLQTATSHALCRLLISVNPSLAFSSSLPISSAVPPILWLIKSVHTSTADTRDLLPLFEALLALTNLASTTDSIRDSIVKKEFSTVEELLMYHNDMVQRAAVELVCNLMVSPETVALFANGPRSGNRLQILLAIVRTDDVPARLAAGGALAMLTEWDAGVAAVLKREGAVQRCLEMCEDVDAGVMFRGVVVVRNLVIIGGEDGKKKVKDAGGKTVMETVAKGLVTRGGGDAELKGLLVEVLRELMV
ncbi:hypothetical protein ABW19_dt0204114 [Dactylella cylindrospora]|nr:hypothetical protein ABW19_dt0204114 [Dactylella cylindrospora]